MINFFNDTYYDTPVLVVDAGVRYWEDAQVNECKDINGQLIPFRNNNRWQFKINVNDGQISQWPIGTTAKVHYKVCDDGNYTLYDNGHIYECKNQYVPKILDCSDDQSSYGDYIILDINENGYIKNWDLSKFNELIVNSYE